MKKAFGAPPSREKKQDTENEKVHIKTDKELFEKFAVGEKDSLKCEEDKDYAVEDGVRFTPFNMTEELKEGFFDSKGNYHFNETNEKSHDEISETDSDESVDEGEVPTIQTKIEALKQILPLIQPENTVNDALCACDNDQDRLVKLTDLATNLMYIGMSEIYFTPYVELKNELDSLLKDQK